MAPTIATMFTTSVPRIKPKMRFRISALIASIFDSRRSSDWRSSLRKSAISCLELGAKLGDLGLELGAKLGDVHLGGEIGTLGGEIGTLGAFLYRHAYRSPSRAAWIRAHHQKRVMPEPETMAWAKAAGQVARRGAAVSFDDLVGAG